MESKFKGGVLGYIGISLLVFVISVFSLGIAIPWAICIAARWWAKHSEIDGRQVTFEGTGGQLFVKFLKWGLLCIITLFIYSLWVPIKMARWVVSNIHLEPASEPACAHSYASSPAPRQYAQRPAVQYAQRPAAPVQYAPMPYSPVQYAPMPYAPVQYVQMPYAPVQYVQTAAAPAQNDTAYIFSTINRSSPN